MADVSSIGKDLVTLSKTATSGAKKDDPSNFGSILKDSIKEISDLQGKADKAIARVELDDSGSIHEAMIALEKADISFRVMLQVRNKIIDAYQEVMRMQV